MKGEIELEMATSRVHLEQLPHPSNLQTLAPGNSGVLEISLLTLAVNRLFSIVLPMAARLHTLLTQMLTKRFEPNFAQDQGQWSCGVIPARGSRDGLRYQS